MREEGIVIRPPSEADSIILRVTAGCSHNRCTFCPAYKGVRFRILSRESLEEELDFAATYCRRLKRVFLADGDALILPQHRLREILQRIRARLPWITGIATYANAKSLGTKSKEDLEELRALGLRRIYMGLESGHDATLTAIQKGTRADTMIRRARKVREAGLFLSVTVLLGIAGAEASQIHAQKTGEALSAMEPNQIAVLTLMVTPGTPLYRDMESGAFCMPCRRVLLEELRTLVEEVHVKRGQFQANHASNYLPVAGRLPRDKGSILATIHRALAGEVSLVPEYRRAL